MPTLLDKIRSWYAARFWVLEGVRAIPGQWLFSLDVTAEVLETEECMLLNVGALRFALYRYKPGFRA